MAFNINRSQIIGDARGNLAGLRQGSLGIPLLLLALLGMVTLPVPPLLLDTLFTFNIALSIVVLLVAVYALRPLDLAAFPTIQLVATLLRLAAWQQRKHQRPDSPVFAQRHKRFET